MAQNAKVVVHKKTKKFHVACEAKVKITGNGKTVNSKVVIVSDKAHFLGKTHDFNSWAAMKKEFYVYKI